MYEVLCANYTLGSYFLRFVMASKYSHSVVVDGDVVTHSTFLGGGVHKITLARFNQHYPIQSEPKDMGIRDVDAARAWLQDQVGKPYDWTALASIALQWFVKRSWHELNHWFCSELIESIRSRFGTPRFSVDAAWITPKHQDMVL